MCKSTAQRVDSSCSNKKLRKEEDYALRVKQKLGPLFVDFSLDPATLDTDLGDQSTLVLLSGADSSQIQVTLSCGHLHHLQALLLGSLTPCI